MTATRIECVDCAALPEFDIDRHNASSNEWRPRKPRPIDPRSGPRSPRCVTHYRARLAAQRGRVAGTKRQARFGMDQATFDRLWAAQGGRCPCGRQPSRRPDVDHDHDLAAEHGHPKGQACPDCWRGLLCAACNRILLGRRPLGYGYTLEMLEGIVGYLRNPPARALTETGD